MSEENLNVRNVQVRLSEAEHAALVEKVGGRGIQAHVRMLIKLDSSGSGGFPYKAANKVWHDRLERILAEGTERDRIGIEQNIEWAVKSLATRPTKRAKAG